MTAANDASRETADALTCPWCQTDMEPGYLYSGDSIRMHFEDAAQGTICEGAEICVREVKTMLRCPKCHELFVRRPFHFECPHCGTEGEPSEVGKEMAIESIEAQ